MLQPEPMRDSLHAYELSKREAVRWGKRDARVNTISPGIIFTPLPRTEWLPPRSFGRMLE
jgi:NAD(P)-dependent dehydrogenase (short-subunit alcohol dehydrogenase family)